MYKTAILGSGIGYTKSPVIHAAISEATGVEMACDAVDVAHDSLGDTVNKLLCEYDGFFVTKPFKAEICKYIGREDAGVVNVVRSCDRAVTNTDGIGFLRALDRNFSIWRERVSGALVIGAGGAANAVAKALISCGVKVYVINRTVVSAAKLCRAVGAELYANQSVELAVNCTSVSDGDILKNLCILPSFEYAFDLTYNAEKTPFEKRCAESGGKAANGYDMLIYQAIEGDKFLFGLGGADTEKVFDTVRNILQKR